jgi:hypothetical protein
MDYGLTKGASLCRILLFTLCELNLGYLTNTTYEYGPIVVTPNTEWILMKKPRFFRKISQEPRIFDTLKTLKFQKLKRALIFFPFQEDLDESLSRIKDRLEKETAGHLEAKQKVAELEDRISELKHRADFEQDERKRLENLINSGSVPDDTKVRDGNNNVGKYYKQLDMFCLVRKCLS